MTSYQQRKQEIRELKERILTLERLLSEHGIYLGQLTINDKNMKKFQGHRNPPKPPPPKIIREGAQPPKPTMDRKIKEGINYHEFFSGFWEWLKEWFSPSDKIVLSDLYMASYIETKAEALEDEQIKNKYLQRLRRKRKKHYSISTPITMAWKR